MEIKIICPEQRQEIINGIFNLLDSEKDLTLSEKIGILEFIKLTYFNEEVNYGEGSE